jgi:hypothetical protein
MGPPLLRGVLNRGRRRLQVDAHHPPKPEEARIAVFVYVRFREQMKVKAAA